MEVIDEERFAFAGTECAVREVLCHFGTYRNGYARVPGWHSDFGLDYDDLDGRYDFACGEVTYAGDLDGDGGWWIGFDTAHAWDDTSREYAMGTTKALAAAVMARLDG